MTVTSLFAPLRVLAIASVLGTATLAGSFGPVAAQNPAGTKTPAAAAATSNKPETVEQRIESLKVALKITPDQEPKWTSVATAMRDNAAAMDKLVTTKRGKSAESTTAVFSSLYDSMPAPQKANADKVFESFGPGKG